MADPQRELLNIKYAGFWKRFGAYAIDSMLLLVTFSVISTIVDIKPGIRNIYSPISKAEITFTFFAIFLTWLYYTLLESSSRQATIGKSLMKLIVTDEYGKKITFAKATARFFSKLLSGAILMIGYLMTGWTKRKQALHDIVAKTLVLQD